MKKFLRRSLAQAISWLPKGILIDEDHFDIFQARGLHLRPVHFYSAIPNTSEIDRNLWDRPSELPGVDQNLIAQISFLNKICAAGFMDEYHEIPWETDSPAIYSRNGGFGEHDGAALYSMIRKYQPKRIIEIGSGASTLASCLALHKNGKEFKLTTIDPHPPSYLYERDDIDVMTTRVERVPFAIFEELEANDILFIDSSHTVRIGGDVLYEVLEIIPRLKFGVLVHIHDVFLPYHYPKHWVIDRHVFWTEQYLVQAFLAFNKSFQILWSFNMMYANCNELLNEKYGHRVGKYEGSSLWLRKIG